MLKDVGQCFSLLQYRFKISLIVWRGSMNGYHDCNSLRLVQPISGLSTETRHRLPDDFLHRAGACKQEMNVKKLPLLQSDDKTNCQSNLEVTFFVPTNFNLNRIPHTELYSLTLLKS